MALEVQGSLGESSEIFITRLCKLLSFARRSLSWQLFEATDFNGSSDRQCGLCSRNCERQRSVRWKLLHITYFFLNHYIIAALKNFYQSTGIVAGMGFPTFVADNGCVSSPSNMMIHKALDWWRRSMISDRGKKEKKLKIVTPVTSIAPETLKHANWMSKITGQSP